MSRPWRLGEHVLALFSELGDGRKGGGDALGPVAGCSEMALWERNPAHWGKSGEMTSLSPFDSINRQVLRAVPWGPDYYTLLIGWLNG